jgi:hypothetical protein
MKKNNSILAIQMPDTKNQQSHLLMETGTEVSALPVALTPCLIFVDLHCASSTATRVPL